MKTQTAAATALTVAATPTQYTGPLGRHLAKMAGTRGQIMDIVGNSALFTDEEHLRTNDNVFQCESLEQLERWLRNVSRVAEERKISSLRLDFADGTSSMLVVEAPVLPVGVEYELEFVKASDLEEFDLVVRKCTRTGKIDCCGYITALKLTKFYWKDVELLLVGHGGRTITVTQHHPNYYWFKVVLDDLSTAQPA